MATNKKITQLDELTPATWADDDVIAIVDISAQETKKIQLSTFRGAVTGVSSLNASTPLTVDSATGDVTISVAIDGGGTINAVFDEDNMASNSPTALATQQSIKAYVDSQVGTVDTLAEILANGNTSGGTNIVVSSGDVITTNTINETTAAAGVTIDGVLVKDGQVDGRDVSVDGTKLDTVETNADVTDTANVTAAGALMDSELTNITAVKALDQGVATTDTPTFAGLITAGNVDGRDVSADGAKLDGIEAGADVTDTANVTSAGAVMDSELTNITAVKALNQGVATTDSPSFAGLTATTADINGGTIDGTVIGGASAAAGTFTTLITTGNAGIGTATPSSALNGTLRALEVSSTLGSSVRATDTASSTNIEIAAGVGSTYVWNTTNTQMQFGTNNASRMTLTAAGNLQMANAAGPALLNEAASSTNPTLVPNKADTDTGIGWASADTLTAVTGGSERMRIDSSGRVGIGGAPSVGSPLEVRAGVSSTIEAIASGGNRAVINAQAGGVLFGSFSAATVNFVHNVSTIFQMDGSSLSGANAAGPAMLNEAASSTNPTLVPNRANPGDGIGAATAGNLHLITNGGNRVAIGGDGVVNILTAGSFGTPALSFNSDYDTGIYHSAADTLAFATGGGGRLTINTSTVTSGLTIDVTTASGPALLNEPASSANPTLVPNKADPDTGVGWASADIGALVAGGTEAARWNATGLGLGTVTPSYKLDIQQSGATAAQAVRVADSTPTEYFGIFNANNGGSAPNAANATVKIRGMATTSRSINAGGTVNASGADYAEYMRKAEGCGDIAKGDVCGVDANGKITDKFDDAIAFVVKSTDPAYVGGDVWAKSGEVDADGNEIMLESDALEAARHTVDRIAFSGQVPCNTMGPAQAGDYVVPARSKSGGIVAECVASPDFDQYRKAVGQVWKIQDDGRPFIAIKIS